MSWRDLLAPAFSEATPYAQYSHNSQKPSRGARAGNFADIADIAQSIPAQESSPLEALPDDGNFADIADIAQSIPDQRSRLLEALADACKGIAITPSQVLDAMAPEDIDAWSKGEVDGKGLTAFARALVQRQEMNQGLLPESFNTIATCQHCGPIWLWFAGDVWSCPWCWNRVAGRPIPRPFPVRCADCLHFARVTDYPHHGRCNARDRGTRHWWWDTDLRVCDRFLPRPPRSLA